MARIANHLSKDSQEVSEVAGEMEVIAAPKDVEQPPPKFLFSGLKEEDRCKYAAMIRDLGGSVSNTYNNMCTHLISGVPLRNEKYLGCLAAGKWILHKSYLKACERENRFVDEAAHEWGSEGSDAVLDKLSPLSVKLAKSARRWRMTCSTEESKRPFKGWKTIICMNKVRGKSFCCIMEAGGADLSGCAYPYSRCAGVTHAILDLEKAPFADVDLRALAKYQVRCVRPEYVSAYLIEDPAPDFGDYIIPEMVAILSDTKNLVLFSSKRKKRPPECRQKRNRMDVEAIDDGLLGLTIQ